MDSYGFNWIDDSLWHKTLFDRNEAMIRCYGLDHDDMPLSPLVSEPSYYQIEDNCLFSDDLELSSPQYSTSDDLAVSSPQYSTATQSWTSSDQSCACTDQSCPINHPASESSFLPSSASSQSTAAKASPRK